MHFQETNKDDKYQNYIIPFYTRIKIFSKSGKVILSDRYKLYEPKTIIKLKIRIDPIYIYVCCQNGYVHILEFLKKSKLSSIHDYSEGALLSASTHNKINVLEWWENSWLPMEYSERILDDTSYYGNINVLEWWKNSGLDLKYDQRALHYGRVAVPEWWKKSGLELKK